MKKIYFILYSLLFLNINFIYALDNKATDNENDGINNTLTTLAPKSEDPSSEISSTWSIRVTGYIKDQRIKDLMTSKSEDKYKITKEDSPEERVSKKLKLEHENNLLIPHIIIQDVISKKYIGKIELTKQDEKDPSRYPINVKFEIPSSQKKIKLKCSISHYATTYLQHESNVYNRYNKDKEELESLRVVLNLKNKNEPQTEKNYKQYGITIKNITVNFGDKYSNKNIK